MPRPACPPALKCLRTYEVKTTQTTAEELWSHFTDEFAKNEKTMSEYAALLDRAASEFYGTNNPYSECSWRRHAPDRLYQLPFEWLCRKDDDYMLVDQHFYILKLLGDLKLCVRHLGWDTDLEYKEKVNEMLEMAEKYQNEIRSGIEELKVLEERKYHLARQAWYKANPGLQESRAMRTAHENHHTPEEWREIFKRDPDCARWYDDKIPEHADCYWCNKRQEETALYKAECEERRKEIEAMKETAAEIGGGVADGPFEPEIGDYNCVACKFHTQYGAVYNIHLRSAEHLAIQKQKSLFCERCNIQCRTLIEFNQHLTTKKHRHAENPDAITPQVFSCEPCGYSTIFKHVFENHLRSKRHSEKAAPAAAAAAQ
jgi:hypothetical protein